METNAMFIRQFIIGAFDSLNQGDFYKLCDALLAGAKAFMEHPPKDITDLNGAWNAGCYFGKAILTELSK